MKKVGDRERPGDRLKHRLDRNELATQTLLFLAADPDRLGRFLALTGLDPSTIRTAAGTRAFTAAVLGYLAGDEALLVEFAASEGLDPAAVGREAQADPERRRLEPDGD